MSLSVEEKNKASDKVAYVIANHTKGLLKLMGFEEKDVRFWACRTLRMAFDKIDEA